MQVVRTYLKYQVLKNQDHPEAAPCSSQAGATGTPPVLTFRAEIFTRVCDKKVGILRPLFGKEGCGEIFFERCYSENPPSPTLCQRGNISEYFVITNKFVAHPSRAEGWNLLRKSVYNSCYTC
jgi:hypothetical protein